MTSFIEDPYNHADSEITKKVKKWLTGPNRSWTIPNTLDLWRHDEEILYYNI